MTPMPHSTARLELGAWEIPVRARAMELNIPAIHGVGESLIYFVDRYDEFSIYDVDFRAIPTVDPHPPAQDDALFGLSSTSASTGPRTGWSSTRRSSASPPSRPTSASASLPKGLLLQSPCKSFYLQLIEPDDTAKYAPYEEHVQHIGFGTPDVLATVGILEQRGIEFLASEKVHTSERGALTKARLGSVMFELVHDVPAPAGSPR